ncbi:MAG: hypothetical protein Kow0092_17210 [Deferrisomatales bacterium]
MTLRQRLARAALAAALAAAASWPGPAWSCFGQRLKVGVPPGRAGALAAYAAGYFVEEKTGIEPEFVALSGQPGPALLDRRVDLVLVAEAAEPPGGVAVRPAGEVPGLGRCRFWLHPDVLDDLRFFTVDRSLGRAPALFGSPAYRELAGSSRPPRSAARQAVLRLD